MPKESRRPLTLSKLIDEVSNARYAEKRSNSSQVTTKKFFRSRNTTPVTSTATATIRVPIQQPIRITHHRSSQQQSSITTTKRNPSTNSRGKTTTKTTSTNIKPANLRSTSRNKPESQPEEDDDKEDNNDDGDNDADEDEDDDDEQDNTSNCDSPPDAPVKSPNATSSVDSVVQSPVESPMSTSQPSPFTPSQPQSESVESTSCQPHDEITNNDIDMPNDDMIDVNLNTRIDESSSSNHVDSNNVETKSTTNANNTTSSTTTSSISVASSKPTKRKFFTRDREKNITKPQIDPNKFFKASDAADDLFGDPTIASSAQDASNLDDDYVTLEKVRKAHQCHELGETEAFDEDITYYLNSLEKANSIHIRCLAIEALTTHCMGAEFRMHLRAHDDMPKITTALNDAPTNPNLAFCTALLMFIYNQDRLTMDIDPKHLGLMLDLLETKDDLVEAKHRKKAKGLVEQMKVRGHGKFLDPSNLSTGKLALEALLGLTSKRAGDWFKEELRNLKGLDYLMNTVIKIVQEDDKLRLEAELNKVERTLRVLEAATYMHEENQLYTINYQGGLLIRSSAKLLQMCKDSIVLNDSRIHLSTLLSVLRVFTNVTSESAQGSELLGSQFTDLLALFLDILFEVPSFIYPDSRFDLMVLVLCLCINLVEFYTPLRQGLLKSTWKVKQLVEILLKRIEEAKETEQQADDLLDNAEKDNMTDVVNIDTLLNQVVAKSGKHMEHSIIAACVSLLLGCTIQQNPDGKNEIARLLPKGSFEPLIDVLTKLREFANLADIMTPTGIRRVERILRVFKSPIASDESPKREFKREEPSSPSLLSISESFLTDADLSLCNASDSISC